MTTAHADVLLPFKPLSWQVAPWRDRSPIILLTGSAGGGKSHLAAEKINAFCKYYTGAMALALRKTRESMNNSTVLFLDRGIIGSDEHVRHLSGSHRFEYDNTSILAYGGMKDDEQREQIRSIGQLGGVDIVWMEEAHKFTRADFDEVQARMRGTAAPWTQIILTTNPDAPSHWINRDLIIGGGSTVYYSHAELNTYNPEAYLVSLDNMTGVTAKRLREGKWVQAEGAVYDDYDSEVHLIPAFDIPNDWRRFRVIDFGYTNPFVCQWWAEDGDGRLFRFREIYMTRQLVEDTAKMIAGSETITPEKDGQPAVMERISETICDHDAEDRATLEKHLRQLGCTAPLTKKADKRVQAGIQAVQLRLRKAGDGRARLFLLQGALTHSPDKLLLEAGKPTSTEEEVATYRWHSDATGRANKEEPVKEDDHGMDTMRYMVMRLDGKASPQVLFV